jgi:hypothetical protein
MARAVCTPLSCTQLFRLAIKGALVLLFIISSTQTRGLLARDKSVRIDYVDPPSATLGKASYRMLYGKNLNSAESARITSSEGPMVKPNEKLDTSTLCQPADLDPPLGPNGQRGVRFGLSSSFAAGKYWIQLLNGVAKDNACGNGAGTVVASVLIFVRASTAGTSTVASADQSGSMPSPFVRCENGDIDATTEDASANTHKIYCTSSVLSQSEVSDEFGNRVANTYYAIQVGVANNDAQYDYLLRSIVLTLPGGQRVSSRVKRFAQGVAAQGQVKDRRNILYNTLAWGGSVWGALSVFSFATTNFKNGANIFQGPGLKGFPTVFPDASVENVTRFGNAVFDDQQPLVVPKRSVGQPPLFTIALVPRPSGKGYSKAYLSRLGDEIGVAVEGVPIQTVNPVTFSTGRLDFGPQTLGTVSEAKTLTVTNSGLTPVSLSIQQAPDFQAALTAPATGEASSASALNQAAASHPSGNPPSGQSTTNNRAPQCGNLIPGNATCQLWVVFAPAADSNSHIFNEAISIDGNFAGAPQQVRVAGTASPLEISSVHVRLGASPQTPKSSTRLSVRNVSVNPVDITIDDPGGPDQTSFTLEKNECGKQLAAKKSCTVTVTFKPNPQMEGTQEARLVIADGNQTTQTVQLEGTVQWPAISWELPNPPDFGTDPTKDISLVLKNTGHANLDMALDAFTISGAQGSEFSLDTKDKCPHLESGGQCQIHIHFKPMDAGKRTATLTLDARNAKAPINGDPFGSITVDLSGIGVSAFELSSSDLPFPPVSQKSTKAENLTLTNTGNVPLTIAATISGDQDFNAAESPCPPVAPSKNCSIKIAFSPQRAGSRTATLTLRDPHVKPAIVKLRGQGTAARKVTPSKKK